MTEELTVTPRGEECDVEWKIDFDSLSKKDNEYYCSPDFNFQGETWLFTIRPNGSKGMYSNGYLHLRIFKRNSENPPIRIEISFSLKTVNGEKDLESRCTEIFKGWSWHEFFRFFSTPDLEKRRSEFLESGHLTVVCKLKRLDPTESANTVARVKCSYCEKTFNAREISFHEKKCLIKCPKCSDVILLENWNEHECQITKAEGVESLCQDFKNVLLDGINHDLILKIDKKEFRAHRDVLRARSPVFKSMLTHDMVEKNSGVIDVPDCDPQAMQQFLYYIYSGKIESLDQNNMISLYYIADKYEMNELKEECSKFIKQFLSPTNFCDVIQLALNHSDSKLQDFATEYFIRNVLDILHTVEWQSFLKNNSILANELMIKSHEKKK